MLELRSVTKRFSETTAVDTISFSIGKGEVLGLLGHNGAGKSTTIKMILGILTPSEGEILWEGLPIRQSSVRMGYLPEERGLYEKSRVEDQLRYFGKLEGMKKTEIDESITYWLDRLEIPGYRKKYVRELSKGNRQKIQLIVALLHDPDLVILDEPFSGLDPLNAKTFADVIQELIEAGKTIILSSHRMEQLDRFCKQVFIMKQGREQLAGEVDHLKRTVGVRLVEVKSDRPIQALLADFNPVEQNEFSTIAIQNDQQAFEIFDRLRRDGHQIRHFVMREPTLHELFVEAMTS